MKRYFKYFFIFLILTALLLLFCACSSENKNNNTTSGAVENSEKIEGSAAENTNEGEDDTVKDSLEFTTSNVTEDTTDVMPQDGWYVKEGSVKTEFELGEKFNYKGIVVIHKSGSEIFEYPEDDIYIDEEPVLNRIGDFEVTLEVLSEEITLTYTVTVKDVDVEKALLSAPVLNIDGSGAYRCEIENIDLSLIKSTGTLVVDDIYASGEKFVQNYGSVGNCFGFKVTSEDDIASAKLVIRMANFSVTMIYPAKNLAIYQNYKSFEDNTRLVVDENYYLTTRAPSMSGQAGADTSLVWCEVVIENITLKAGENTFAFVVIGKDAPFLDYAEIIIP